MRPRSWLRISLLAAPAACFSDAPDIEPTVTGSTAADTSAGTGATQADPTSGSTGSTSSMSGSASATGDTSGDTDMDGCPVGAEPVPEIPAGWGDVIYTLTLGPPELSVDCMMPLGQGMQLGVADVPGSCNCTCPGDLDVICDITLRTAAGCAGIDEAPFADFDEMCEQTFAAVVIEATPLAVDPAESPPLADQVVHACSGPIGPECVPVPPDFTGPCIASQTEKTCPPAFPVERESWRSVCSSCPTPDTAGYCGALVFERHLQADCGGRATASLSPGATCSQDASSPSVELLLPPELPCPPNAANEPERTLICCVGA